MSLIIQNAHAILSGLPGEAARLAGPDIRIRDGKIAAIGSLTPLPEERQIDACDCVIYPAWVNTHHHLFQSLLKGEPQGLNQSLTAWLSATPYRFRAAFDEHTFRLAVRIGLVELLRSGCASVADHNYLYWPDMPFDTSEIVFSEGEALGMRIVLCRGGATRGPGGGTGSAGGAASGNLRRLYGGCRTAGQPLSRPPARVSAPGGDGAHYRPALRAGRPAAGDGEAGPPAGDPVAQPFIGNRRLSRRRAAEIRHDAGAVLRGTRLAGK